MTVEVLQGCVLISILFITFKETPDTQDHLVSMA